MDQEPEFYVSPEDLEAQMTADERGEGAKTQPLFERRLLLNLLKHIVYLQNRTCSSQNP